MTRKQLFFSAFVFLFVLIASTSARADYVSQTTGHGPFYCNSALPDHGYVDIVTGSDCWRWRGDFIGDSTAPHPGYVIPWTAQAQSTVIVGPGAWTTAFICEGQALNPSYLPCDPHFRQVVVSPGGSATPPFIPKAVVLRYLPQCPNTPGMTHLFQCHGTWTPFDGSGYATVAIDDGGESNTLNLPNPPSSSNECFVDLANWPWLSQQFTPPPGYTHGTRVVAVASGTCY